MMLKRIHEVGDKVLGLVEGILDMGPLPLRYEIGMGVAYYTLILYMSKGKHEGHLPWDHVAVLPIFRSMLHDYQWPPIFSHP